MKKQDSNKPNKLAAAKRAPVHKKQARKPLISALEPRLLLDGAAVVTAVEAFTDSQLHDGFQTDASQQDTDTSFVIAPTEVRAVDPALNNGKKEVVFIVDNVSDTQTLIDGINAGIEVVLLDSTQDGLAQMASWAQSNSDYDAIHIISHGAEGQVNLGDFSLDAITVNTRASDLAALGAALNEDGDLLLYGCEVASGEGQDFIIALAKATQADVAASDDLTGASALNGDWELEQHSGSIETELGVSEATLNSYRFTLADETFDFESGVTGLNTQTVTAVGTNATFTIVGERDAIIDDDDDAAAGLDPINGNTSLVTGGPNYAETKYTFSIDSGKTFDLSSISLHNWDEAETFIFESSKGTASFAVESDNTNKVIDVASHANAANFEGISSFTITDVDNGYEMFVIIDDLVVTNITAVPANNAPTISSAPSDITVTEDTASNVDLSTVTFADSDGDGLTATLTVSAGTLAASSGGSVTVSGSGTGTLTLTGTAANINTYLDTASNIQYTGVSNASGDDAATLSITANDGTTDSATTTVNIDITAVNDEPTLTATPLNPTFTEGGADVTLFNNPNASTVEAGQTIEQLTLTVSNISDLGNEFLTFGSVNIALQDNQSASHTSPATFSYTVSVTDTTATVTINASDTAAVWQNYVPFLKYKNTSEAPTEGSRVVTLTSVTDSGSNSGTNDNVADLSIASTVAVVQVPAVVTSVAATTSNDSYNEGDVIAITVTFDDAVTVTGTPQLILETGSVDRVVDYVSGSGSNTLTFNYTVQAGDTSADLDYISTSALTLNGGSIKDAGGYDATLTLATPGASDSLGANKAIVIDTTAPSSPNTPDMTAGTDRGASSTDDITNDTMPTFIGTAEAGATVALYDTDGTTSLGSATADGSGNWSITSSALSTGSHILTTKATDAAGNVSVASSGLSVTIDSTSPNAPGTPNLVAASDSGSSSTDDITNDTTPRFVGFSAEAGAIVTLYDTDGTTVIATTTANGAGNWLVDSSALAEGAHNITAKVTDTAGNVSVASSGLSITIDSTAPSAPSTPDLETASDSGASSTDNITSDSTPTVSGTSDASAAITLFDTDGTTVLGTTTADGSGNWNITSSALSAGSHTLTAKATDVAGNVSVASSGLSVTIDSTAPNAPTIDLSSSSDTGSSTTDNITNDTTPTITGTAEANATVILYGTDGTTELGSTTADGSGNWTITSSVLAAGSHTLTAKATDAAGNTSVASSGLSVTVDTTAPTLSSSSPADNAVQVTPSGDITLTFDETVAKGYDEITLINVTTGATVETFDVLNGGNLTYSGNTVTLNPTNDLKEATTYAIRLDANAVRDVAGNNYVGISDNTTLNFTTGVTDSAAPTFLSIQRANDNVVTGSTTSFTLTFNEAVNAVAGDFELHASGSVAGTIGTITGSGTNTITVNVMGISGIGTLGLNLKSGHTVTDLAGNALATAEPSDDEVYTVDTVAPTLISINRVDSETTNADSVQFMAVFSETVTGLGIDDFELTGTAINGASISSVTGTGNGFVITVAGVTGDGTLGMQLKSAATVTDTATNALTAATASAVTEQYTIDNTAPTATAIITTNAALSTADTVTFNVTFSEAVANVSVEDFEISGDVTGTVSAVSGSGSSYTVTVSNIVGDGALGLNFKSGQNITDIAGNALAGTEPTTDESYTIDNTLPTVTSISRGMVNQVKAGMATDVVFTVVFSETVSDIATGDFSVTGNAANTGVSSVSSADGKVFKVTVSGVNGSIGQTVGLNFTGSATDAVSQASTAQFTAGDSYTIAGTLLNEGALTQAQLDAIVDLNREGTLLEQSVTDAKEVVIVDSRVPGLVDLTKQANPNADIWLLDGSRSATEQITEILSNYSDLDALHILSHGGVGEVYLGADTVSADAISQNSATFAAWGNALSDNGDILLYGCNVAQGDMGVDFINQLAQVTGADIAASDDLTGSAVLGGDWDLEQEIGNVDTAYLANQEFQFVLNSVAGSINLTGQSRGDTYGDTLTDGEGGTSDISGITYEITYGGAAGVNVMTYWGMLGVGGEGFYLATSSSDTAAVGADSLIVRSNGGESFSLESFYIIDQFGNTGTFTVTGYLDGVSVSGAVQTFTIDQSGTYSKTVTLSSDFQNVDEVRVTSTGFSGKIWEGFNNFVFGDPVGGNSAPTITGAPADITVTEDTASNVDLSGVTFADSDGDGLTATLTASAGTLAASSGGSVTVSGSGTGTLTLTGTAANINTYLDTASNIQYTGVSNASGDNAATLSIKANDGTVDSSTSTVNIDITAVNDAPTDIALSDTTYGHSEGATDIVVGSFSSTDADTGESFTYALVSGSGDTNNGLFNINGADLRVADRANVPAGTYSIRVQVNDGDTTFEKSFSITVSDDIAPTIATVVPTDGSTGVSVADSIEITFDENVSLGTSGTITLFDITGNGANSITLDVNTHASQLSISGNKLTINPSSDLIATNQYALQLTAGALKDSANNGIAVLNNTTSYNFTTGNVDTTAPTVAIVDIADPTQPNAGTVSINFSEQVTNVDISDFTLTRGGANVDLTGLTVAGSGSAYTLNLSSVTSTEGTYVLTLNTSNITDTSGNALATGDSERFIIDTTVPTGVAIVRAGAETQNGSAATFTAVFSEAVSGVDTADFVLTGTAAGGSITSVTQVSDSVYTITVNGVSSDGTLGVNLKGSGTGITDTAGNAISAGETGQQVTIDNTGPSVVAINRDGAVLTTADSATYTVTFNEAVNGIDVSDFSLSGGATGTVASITGSGLTYQVTVNNISGDGSLRLDLNASGTGITDTVSNAIGAGFTSGDTLTIDNTAPVVTASQAFNLDEGMITDTVIGQVKATETNGVSQFSIQSGNDNGYFAIDNNGVVTLTSAGAAAVDYETATSYTLNIVAIDAVGQASNAAAVTISINDINDNAPVFSSAATASLAENTVVTTPVYTAAATDDDATPAYNSVTYSLKATGDHDAFTIDTATGEVKLKAAADYETKSSYSFTVIASDGMRSVEKGVTLSITDVNEHAPVFTSGNTGSVDENAVTTTPIYTATATDADGTAANKTLRYSLSGDDASLLNINATTGVVTLKASADYETKASYSFNVVATDNGAGNFNSGSLSTTQAVTVSVNDLNDNTPVITSGATGSVNENAATDTVIYTATGTDSDGTPANNTLRYSLSGDDASLLNINATTGAVTLKASADYETKASYSFNVIATDNGAGNFNSGSLSTTQAVTVSVNDLNDNTPVITSGATGSVNENADTSIVIYKATGTDADGTAANNTLRYSLSGDDASLLNINATTGVVTLKASADYETKASYSFNVIATDNGAGNFNSGSLSTTQAVTVSVNDLNDNAPTVSAGAATATLVEAGGVNNSDAGTNSATITLTKSDVDTVGVVGYDAVFLINNGWTTTDNGQTYSRTGTYGTATITTSTDVIRYVLNNNATSTQSLTNGQSVTDSFTIQITDGSATGTTTAVFNITGANDAPIVSGTVANMSGTSGQIFTPVTLPANLFSDRDANDQLVWSVENLPTGLAFNAATRTISGTPQGGFEGVNTLQVVATDIDGAQVRVPVTLTLNPAPAPASASSPVEATRNVPTQNTGFTAPDIVTPSNALPTGVVETSGGSRGFTEVTASAGVSQAQPVAEAPVNNAPNAGQATGVNTVVVSESRVAVNVGADGQVQVSEASGVSSNFTGLSVATIVPQGERVSITIADTSTVARYSGTLADGTQLPDWVAVNPTTGEVTMTPPQGEETITLKINAVDADGNTRILEIEVDLSSVSETPPVATDSVTVNEAVFKSLDEQLTAASEQFDDYGNGLMKLLVS